METSKYVVFAIPIILLMIFIEYSISKIKKRDVYAFSDSVANLCCGILERLFDTFFVLLLYFLFDYIQEYITPFHIPENVTTWFAALIFADFLAYWHHRLSHEINFMWAAHGVHHQSEELNMTTVFRVSALAVIDRAFFFIWLPVVGFTSVYSISVIIFIGLFQFLTHTRLVAKLGILEYLFVTPSHHRVHHATNKKYIDKNYGHVFILWDKLFGTFEKETEEPFYGIISGFNRSNVFSAYFSYWKNMFHKSKATPNRWHKFLIFIKPPGWLPQGTQPDAPIYKTDSNGIRIKYRVKVDIGLQWYIGINAIVTLLCFYYLSYNRLDFLTINLIILIVFVILSVASIGLMLEKNYSVVFIEYSRLLIIFGCCLFNIFQEYHFMLTILLILSILMMLIFRHLIIRVYFNLDLKNQSMFKLNDPK